MDVDEVLSRRSSPMPKKPWLDLCCFERLSKQRVFKQIDLPDAQVVCRPPVAIHLVEHIGRKRPFGNRSLCFNFAVCRNCC